MTRLDIQRFLVKLFKKQSTERGVNASKPSSDTNNKGAGCDSVPRSDDRKLLKASLS